MPRNEWQQRVERAQRLAREHPAAAELLSFYAAIAAFQQRVSLEFSAVHAAGSLSSPLPEALLAAFDSFLATVSKHGPPALANSAGEWQRRDGQSRAEMLTAFWQESSALEPGAPDFLARAFLQPYAAFVRSNQVPPPKGRTPRTCPHCGRKPGSGVLRPQGDGGLRSLICSLCLGEWEFRRILCPACGEENNAKLPVYTAEDFPHVRVECCDTCRCYIKTVDLTKNGLADPVVDEIAAIPLDLWAQEQGYAKLQRNLLQM